MGVLKYILLFVGLEILPMIYNELICLFIGTHWVYILFTTQINFSLKNTQFCYHANFPPPRKKLVKDNLLYTIAHMFYNCQRTIHEQHTGRPGIFFCSYHITNNYIIIFYTIIINSINNILLLLL